MDNPGVTFSHSMERRLILWVFVGNFHDRRCMATVFDFVLCASTV